MSAPAVNTDANRLSGRVALITGASSGIGAATARRFAAAGAKLVLTGRDEKKLNAVVADIKRATPAAEIATLTGDVGTEAHNEALVQLALARVGALHIAFNNAGAVATGAMNAVNGDDMEMMLSTNVKSVVYGQKHQMQAMAKSSSADSWGVIINNSSVVSTRVKSVMKGYGMYAASKSAVDTLTKYAALEGGEQHIRVNAVNPGWVASEMAVGQLGGKEQLDTAAMNFQINNGTCTLDELAEFVLFVADNKTGRFFNGSCLLIDGGNSCK